MAAVNDVGRRAEAARLEVTVPARVRLPLMALAIFALLGALAGGLARLGWSVPSRPGLVAFHGPLMIGGFLGTLIGLERAVAIGRMWAYAGPLATGVGAVAIMTGVPGGAGLMTVGSAMLVIVFVHIVRQQTALFTIVMGLAAACWLAGQLAWVTGAPIHRAVFWWVGFLVLTIVGERLELSRLLRPSTTARGTFLLAATALVVGLGLLAFVPDSGVRVIGASLTALAAWLGAFDIARRTVRAAGLTRFIAVALLGGYVWLGVSGVLALAFGDVAAGRSYDAILHAVFLGFVFSMIFGHAPIVLPAVLGIRLPYRPSFYLHLAILHASLILRVLGDLASWPSAQRWGGLLNAVAIVLFFANTARSALSSRSAA